MNDTSNKGFTLIELLVAMAVASIMMAVVVATYQVQVRGKNTQEAMTDMNQTMRGAMEVMINEICKAGFDTVPASSAIAGILLADSNQLRFTMDISNGVDRTPDGDVNDPGEDIRYAINTSGHLGRDVSNSGTLQPLARNVDALNFVYFDNSTPPAVMATPVAAGQLANIRSIQVTIVARAGEAGGVGFVGAHTDSTAYFNPQGDEILAAQNDSYRRVMFSTLIQCRNLGI
ncbi:prepilin-type cleavage/methylation domain protein [Desulfosarcina variabilis str. Montpellier]|uniref:prepilin-type N-terminal cleavage/methylation domain-containing protein n=1 Tax=Desulfosarcina variabilis TaxID=2300 RepID=UPI003AFB08A4